MVVYKGPDGSDQSNYIENEWRYVVTGEGIDWKWSLDEYKKWRGKASAHKDHLAGKD